jgi:hypothetical protein
MKITRAQAAKLLWIVTALWLIVMLTSLHTGWLSGFFFDSTHAHVQGIDFFPVERAFLNFVAGRSQYDTFAIVYGPYATWFLYHPALALVLGPLLAPFEPWTAYVIWTAISFALMAASAWLVLRRTKDPVRRALVALLMLGGFPVYIMLFVGNVQALLVLSITLVLVAVDSMREEGPTGLNQRLLLTGLLLSLFSKPAVFAMLPILLMLHETRRATLKALGIYIAVSFLLIVIPGFNPVSMSWDQRILLARHPALILESMNVYTNGFHVTPAMQDNSIHWLAMIGLSGFRFQHIDVYSLPTFLDGLFHTLTPAALYRIPAILILAMSALVWFIRSRAARLEAALLVLMASSLLVFLSYGLVWEYHYTSVFPLAALLLVRKHLSKLEWIIVVLGVVVWLPSLYFALSTEDASQLWVETLLRLDRVVPVLAIFCLLLVRAWQIAREGGLRAQPALGSDIAR